MEWKINRNQEGARSNGRKGERKRWLEIGKPKKREMHHSPRMIKRDAGGEAITFEALQLEKELDSTDQRQWAIQIPPP